MMAMAPVVAGVGFLSAPAMAEEVEPTDVVVNQTSSNFYRINYVNQAVSLTVSEQDVFDQKHNQK